MINRLTLSAAALAFLVLSIALATSAAEPAQECNIRESARSYTLWTADGLRLTINRSNGSISSLALGGTALGTPDPRHAELDSASQLPTPRHAELDSASRPVIRFEEVIESKSAPNLLSDTPTTKRASTVRLNQTEPAPLVLSGSCRYSTKTETAGFMNRGLALNIVGTYTDGEKMPEQSAYFGQYDHGFQFNSKVLCPDKPLAQVDVKPAADDPKSVASFKGITLRQAQYRVTSPMDPCSRLDSTVSHEFAIKDSAIAGVARYQAAPECIIVRCRFRSETKQDRALSAYVAIPFDAVGGVWHDDVRASRKIEAGRLYRRGDRWYGAGRDGYEDRYPLGCVENKGGLGLCIATDPGEPRVFRTEYDAAKRELRIRYDIGLSPDAGRWANQGSFTACIFTYQRGDGFRGAEDKYQRIFDWAFARRIDGEGMWIPFVTPESIPGGSEDFRIRFVESLCNIGWERAQGMYSLKYVEPWLHHQTDMPDSVLKMAGGPADPMASVKLARRITAENDATLPKDVSSRFAAYPGSYITDNWGQPQGYFFRQAERKENMMIVNPNPDLPAPTGAHFSSGGFDWDNSIEAGNLDGQWHIDGWMTRRCAETPTVQIDTDEKVSGGQSLRLDSIPARSYYPIWTRGVDQTFYYTGGSAGPFEFSYSVKGKGIPTGGTRVGWTVTFWYEDGSTERHPIGLDGLGPDWKRSTQTFTTKAKPFAITVGFGKDTRDVDPTTVWVDDVKLIAQGDSTNLLANGDFESAQLMPGQFGGVYLDTMECYANNLNYRREHWLYAEEPLTFDSARKPALHQVYSHVTYGRRAAEWARSRGKVVFANCSPITPFAAPYLDAMGGEESWLAGDKLAPKPDREFNFVRFMSGAKSWSILQYSDLNLDQITRYAKRCAFYGVYPSWIYKWTDPVFAAKIRPLYAKLMPTLVEINTAGWRPLTLAKSSSQSIWLERFGDGDTIYLTAFNPTSETQTAVVTIDKRAALTPRSTGLEMLEGSKIGLSGADTPSFEFTLAPEDLRIIKITR